MAEQSGGWGVSDSGEPLFPRRHEASKCPGWELVHAGDPGRVALGRPRVPGAAPALAPRGQLGRAQEQGRLGRLDTEPELARTWSLTLHLWLTLGNHL